MYPLNFHEYAGLIHCVKNSNKLRYRYSTLTTFRNNYQVRPEETIHVIIRKYRCHWRTRIINRLEWQMGGT